MSQYPASGALFSNQKKQRDNQPDYTGSIELSGEVVQDLWNQLQSGVQNPKADLAGWKKTSKSGRPFLSLRGNVLRERNNSAQVNNGYSNRGSYDQAPQQNYQQGQQGQNQQNQFSDEIPF